MNSIKLQNGEYVMKLCW